ncbi:MAG: hypothetical protein OHK0039_18810 [Bacteroidia bacterium]
MKTPLYLWLVLALILALTAGCYREEAIEGQYADEYYVRHAGADLPVWVRGNRQARSFIIYLHGGPGASALPDALTRSLRDVTDYYPVVFYDQRLSGYAHGVRNGDSLSIDQMTEDLAVVIRFIEQQYAPAHIFLMGHSWGGFLGTAFLAEPAYRAMITGWVEVAGAHSFPVTWAAERAVVKPWADSMLALGEDTKRWQAYVDWHERTPTLETLDDLLFVNGYAHSIDGKPGAQAAYDGPSLTWALSSPIAPTSSQRLIIRGLAADLITTDPLTPLMPTITTPTLLIYGRHDAVVPVAVGRHAYDNLGTAPADKTLVIMEEEGHDTWRVTPQRFAGHIRDFIARYE